MFPCLWLLCSSWSFFVCTDKKEEKSDSFTNVLLRYHSTVQKELRTRSRTKKIIRIRLINMKKKIPPKQSGLVMQMKLLFFFLFFFWNTKSRRLWVRRPRGIEIPDLIVREKARDRDEGCRCLRRGSSLGCGPARLCSPEIRMGNFHISPRPPAPL